MLTRFFIVTCIGIAFIIWFFYRLLVKKDLRKHLNELFFGMFFLGFWVLIYWWVTSE